MQDQLTQAVRARRAADTIIKLCVVSEHERISDARKRLAAIEADLEEWYVRRNGAARALVSLRNGRESARLSANSPLHFIKSWVAP